VIGIELGALLGAAVVVETAFSIPGAGLLVSDSIRHHDYATAEGVAVLAGMFMVVVRLALDLIRALVDPRVRRVT
jgi:peptide/nickel transport system permease protein